MSYVRVIPRDLFNESALLKAYGQLYLNIERQAHLVASLDNDDSTDDGFRVEQDEGDGSITLANVHLTVRGLREHYAKEGKIA